MNRKTLLRILGLAILLAIFYFFIDLDKLKVIILKLKLSFFALSVTLIWILIFIRSLRWKIVLERFKITYSMGKCFRIYFVETVAVMVAATLGTFVKAVYPKRDGYGFLRPVLSIIGEKYFDYLLPFIFGAASVVLLGLKIDGDVSLLVLFLVACLAFFPAKRFVVFIFSRIIPKRLKNTLLGKGWDLLKHAREIEDSLDRKTYALSIAGFCVYFFAVYSLTRGLGINLGFSQVVLIMSVTSLVTLLPISFLGIGTWDMVLILAFKWFRHIPEEAIALSIALLFLRVTIVFMGSIFWFIDPPPFLELKEINKTPSCQ